jgi:monofunctional biosynthetic peptidoglycan transglycosylase
MANPRETLRQKGEIVLRWAAGHKLKTAGILLATWIVLEVVTLPFWDVRNLKSTTPTETAFMRMHAEQAADEGKPFKKVQRWVPFGRISRDAVNAVIVAEDGTFWSHSGFDWFEFKESLEKNVTEGRAARGASTITQQLVKNLYLSPSKNPMRKLKEWILTWWMERTLRKQRILELYLNLIEWGRGIYGIEAAAQTYFGKPASSLNREESARLAAVIPNPRIFRVDRQTRYLERRAQLILNRMTARGY